LRQSPKEGAPLGNPAKPSLEDCNLEVTAEQVPDRERDQGPIVTEVRPQKDTGRIEIGLVR
jgi:hypothetical protein